MKSRPNRYSAELKRLAAQLQTRLKSIKQRNAILSLITIETDLMLRLSQEIRVLKTARENRKECSGKVPYRVPVKVLYQEMEE